MQTTRKKDWQSQIKIAKIEGMDKNDLEGQITYQELTNAVRHMKNNKTSGSDGFTVEFFNLKK